MRCLLKWRKTNLTDEKGQKKMKRYLFVNGCYVAILRPLIVFLCVSYPIQKTARSAVTQEE